MATTEIYLAAKHTPLYAFAVQRVSPVKVIHLRTLTLWGLTAEQARQQLGRTPVAESFGESCPQVPPRQWPESLRDSESRITRAIAEEEEESRLWQLALDHWDAWGMESVPQAAVAAAALGGIQSDRKTESSRQNVRKAAEANRKELSEIECTCGRGDAPVKDHKTTCRRWQTWYQRNRRAKERMEQD